MNFHPKNDHNSQRTQLQAQMALKIDFKLIFVFLKAILLDCPQIKKEEEENRSIVRWWMGECEQASSLKVIVR
jgi:hypothetical protein